MRSSTYIRGFDGLRAVSILMVVMNHAGIYECLPDDPFVKERVWHLFSGATGVFFFFAISGFLITTLLLNEKEKYGKINIPHFFIRRFLRLLPPVLVFYIVIIVFSVSGHIAVNGLAFTASLFYIYNYMPQKYNVTELTHTWSLGVEEQFYLLWPFLLARKKLNFIFSFCVIIILLGAVAVFVYPLISFDTGEKTVFLSNAFRPERWFIPAFTPIMAGAAVAMLGFYYKEKLSGFLGSINNVLLSVVLFLSPLYLPDTILPLYFILQSLGVGLFLGWIFFRGENTFVQLLEWKPISFTGKISYGIYIWQGLFLRTGPGSEWWPQQFPQNVVITISVALTSYFILERPVLEWKKKFSHQ